MAERNDIRAEKYEIDKNEDGVLDAVIHVIYRSNSKIMFSMKQGQSETRIFYYDNMERFSETDSDGDGIFEVVRVYGEDNEFDEFHRYPDGSIEPIDTNELNSKVAAENHAYQEMNNYIEEVESNIDIEKERDGPNRRTRDRRN